MVSVHVLISSLSRIRYKIIVLISFLENVPKAIYDELPPRLRQEVNIDYSRAGRS